MATTFPARYEEVSVLGRGGGGQVWAVRDKLTKETLALKALAEDASEREVQALVREAVALSGLEGLGVPKVLRFGRLPRGRRPYLVRELVEGRSLLSHLEQDSPAAQVCLTAIAQAAEQLTGLHRAGLLHGDIKPANIIVSAGGTATLVDLGLAAPWKEGGTRPQGLTPRYAAPELFAGGSLTVRAEIFALGATLADAIAACASHLSPQVADKLRVIAERAMHNDPSQRHPSADELGSALRHAAHMPEPSAPAAVDLAWPVLGVDAAANRLLSQVATLVRGSVIAVSGKPGSGRSVLLRRLAWSLGVEGRDVAWVEEEQSGRWMEALELELGAYDRLDGVVVLIDAAEHLPKSARAKLAAARAAGAKLVLVTSARVAASLGGPVERFVMPPLDDEAAAGLVCKAIPSLSDALVSHVVRR
ncbi:MAG: serine/threonine-protein kinase, partial [Myxococcota bacterium]